jgi:hypothetical protein
MTDTALDTGTSTETIDTYLEAYGEADATRRMQLIQQVWAADGRLLDPPLDGQGHDGISELTTIVHGHYPGHTFRRTTAVDMHHGVARYGWELVGPDGTVAVAGLDVAEFGSDGKIVRVLGFFGDLQPKAA